MKTKLGFLERFVFQLVRGVRNYSLRILTVPGRTTKPMNSERYT